MNIIKTENKAVSNMRQPVHTKGQLFSGWHFYRLKFSKKNNEKIWQQISAQESKQRSNHKIKALYNVFNTSNSPYKSYVN